MPLFVEINYLTAFMEKVKNFFISLGMLFSLLSHAQNISRLELDSLLTEFNRSKSSGIHRVRQLNVLSNKYSMMNLDTTLLLAKQAKELAVQLKDTKGLADALLNISKYYTNKPDYSLALDYALQAADQYENIPDNKGLGEVYSHISMIYKYLGGDKITESYLAKGIEYSQKGYYHAQLAKDTFLMAGALMQSGIIYRDWGKKDGMAFYYDSAFTVFTKAIALAKTGKAVDLTGKLFNNISQVYTEHKKDYHKALEYLMKAIDFNKKNNKTTSLSFNYGNVSANYMNLGNREKALDYAYKTLEIAQQTKLPSRLQNSYGQLYRVYEWTGQYDSALTYFKMMTFISDSLLNVEKTAQISDAQTKYETAKKEAEIKTLNFSNEVKTRNIYALGAGLLVAIVLAISMVALYRKVQFQKILLSEQSAKLELTMKELHHRVKNNLQIVRSLLSLQSYRIRDAEAVAAINESKMRVEAMSLIHQRLYNTDMFTTVNIKEYITDLSSSLMAAYGYSDDDFDLQITVGQHMLDVETALPVGLILNELITNAFKYAFKGIASPSLKISLESKDQQIFLEVQDNGSGLDMANWNKNTGSFGKQLIGSLCNQLRAKQQVTSENGTTFTFIMPAKAA